MEHVSHDQIPPFFDSNSKILILGSMPSRKSREAKFYYMHPQNRFWKILENVFEEKIINKKAFLKKHHIALWDTISSCDIKGASDASIKNVVPNDITSLLAKTQIKVIFTAGKTAEKYYQKYTYPKTKRNTICLPSTSPANCRITMEEICESWKQIREYTK
ncbi:MAG: DNA-deoxyinosine glycosylase [Bacilli bacterium]|jgi:hypoxanthine-DNA glycosylase|nr:DNA-deoxyinosine glycosylase [Bacilli bacterium]